MSGVKTCIATKSGRPDNLQSKIERAFIYLRYQSKLEFDSTPTKMGEMWIGTKIEMTFLSRSGAARSLQNSHKLPWLKHVQRLNDLSNSPTYKFSDMLQISSALSEEAMERFQAVVAGGHAKLDSAIAEVQDSRGNSTG